MTNKSNFFLRFSVFGFKFFIKDRELVAPLLYQLNELLISELEFPGILRCKRLVVLWFMGIPA